MRTLQQHLAEGAGASSSGPTFSLAYDSSSKPGRITQQAGKGLPPGAEFVSKAASKNAKKRANKKAKAGGGDEEDGEAEDGQQQQQQQQQGAGSNGAGQQAAVDAVTQQVRVVVFFGGGGTYCQALCVMRGRVFAEHAWPEELQCPSDVRVW
jgi:hypothetical protein